MTQVTGEVKYSIGRVTFSTFIIPSNLKKKCQCEHFLFSLTQIKFAGNLCFCCELP